MTFRADLHCHTTFSDGSSTPEELILLAKASGLSAISITDHDTILAYESAIPIAKKAGIILGVGAEFSCAFEGMNVHILGYDFDLENVRIQQFCEEHKKRRKERNRRILSKLSKALMPIPEEELEKLGGDGNTTLGRPHIAFLLMKYGYVLSIQEAFNRFLGDDKSCYDPGETFSASETLEVIHLAGGKGFLAHPHFLSDGAKAIKLLDLSFDGIECHYSKCLPQQEKRWVKMAEKKGLIISGGSDYHGSIKSNITLGCSWVDEVTFYRIFQRPIK